MNDSTSPTLETIAAFVGVALLLGCVLLWLRRWKWGPIENGEKVAPEVTPWSRSWTDFMIVILASVMVFVALALTMSRFVLPPGFDPMQNLASGQEASWYTILYSSSIQFALIITIFGAKFSYKIRFFQPSAIGSSALIGFDRLLRYMPLIWVVAALSIFVTEALGIRSGEQDAVTMMQEMQNPWKFQTMVLLAVLVAPVLEEIFFRGILLRFLLGHANPTVALIISSLMFSVLHFNTDSFLPIAVLGFLLGKVYLDTGDLRASIWMHVLFNSQSVAVMFMMKFFS